MDINQPSLKEVERRAYLSTFEDGIFDLAFGLIFNVFALIPALERVGISHLSGYSLLAVPVVVAWLGKQFITIPRMGRVEFGPQRRSRRRLIAIIAAVVLFLTLPLFFMIGGRGIQNGPGWDMIAVMAAPFLLLALFLTEFPRFYIYAALLVAAVVVTEFMARPFGRTMAALYGFGLPGVVVTVVGISLLWRFLKTHPRREAEYAE
jgi:hypothetical protein